MINFHNSKIIIHFNVFAFLYDSCEIVHTLKTICIEKCDNNDLLLKMKTRNNEEKTDPTSGCSYIAYSKRRCNIHDYFRKY